MNRMKSGKVDIAPIHDVDGSCFDEKLVEDVHFVNLAVGNNHHRRDASPKIQEGMELYRSFVLSELCPGKERQAEVDDRGVQCIYCLIQLHAEGVACIELPGSGDQDLGEVGIDPPVPYLVGIGQGVS